MYVILLKILVDFHNMATHVDDSWHWNSFLLFTIAEELVRWNTWARGRSIEKPKRRISATDSEVSQKIIWSKVLAISRHWNWFWKCTIWRRFWAILAFLEVGALRHAKGQVVQRLWKDHWWHEFQCGEAIGIDTWSEAAALAIQTHVPVRNEDERPFPAFKLRKPDFA